MPNTAVRAAGEAMPADKRITFNIHPDEMPDIYAMIVEGDCMLPHIKTGTKLMFSRTEAYQPGDMVILFRRPDMVKPGEHQAIVKRLVLPPAPWAKFGVDRHPKSEVDPVVIVEMFNPRRQLAYSVSGLQGIHKCLGPVPDDVRTYMVSDDEVAPPKRKRRA
ncbi:MAG TPA: S24/S26 family peptidase [Bosea sp. (in: a-proteobacteria)]|nr:S24/S26 family peptidase [Bosea sp. (in: a-proteobacteria)]